MIPKVCTKEDLERIFPVWDHSKVSSQSYKDLQEQRLRPLSMADIRLASFLLDDPGLKEHLRVLEQVLLQDSVD